MKFSIPEISWHNRDPVLSVDFQPKNTSDEHLRLASSGTDSHVLIWYISLSEAGSVNLEVAADLARHQKAVNVVRWSPSGEYLASGDDESIIFIWKQKTEKDQTPAEPNEEYKESWVIYKTLRGHLEDVLDISWSIDSSQLCSGSVDNKLLLWDLAKGKYTTILSDHKGFVQGVAWDPKGQYLASASSDRVFRVFDVNSKKVLARNSKAVLDFPPDHPFHKTSVRLYHDDTLQTFYRRVSFSPNGLFVAVPAGKIEPEQGKVEAKPINAVFIYTRYCLKTPACVLPCGEPALATRWSPRVYRPRADGPPPPLGSGPRMILAVATRKSVILYDTQQKRPLALISNLHYTRLTDLTWSPCGTILVASSTDGFCSVITFTKNELGEILPQEEITENKTEKPVEQIMDVDIEIVESPKTNRTPKSAKSNKTKLDAFIKFKSPAGKSAKRLKMDKEDKTPIRIEVLEDMAMPSWSDNSNNDIIETRNVNKINKQDEIIVLDDSEDIKLVYEETEDSAAKKHNEGSPQDKDCSSLKQEELESSLNKENSKTKHKESKQDKENLTMNNDHAESIPNNMISPKKDNVELVQDKENSVKAGDKDKKVSQGSLDSFLKKAKVTVQETAPAPTAPSPKAPRRVSFITLSSPKNAKKK